MTLAVDATAAVAAVAGRDLDRDGIGMYLALPGGRPFPDGHPQRLDGAAVAAAVAEVHAALAAAGGPGPDYSEGRIGREERLLIEAVTIAAHCDLDGAQLPRTAGGAEGDVAPSGLLAAYLEAVGEGRFVRAVNFHNTPATRADELAASLGSWGRRFTPLDAEGLTELHRGRWEQPRPPLLPVFYEGYRNGFEVAAPACRAAGLTGWFFVISGFVDTPPGDQHAFAVAHHVALVEEEAARDRIAMTWDEVGELAVDHVVCPHTATHAEAASLGAPDDWEREVASPAAAVAGATGRRGPAHAWLYGTGLRRGEEHAAALRAAGVQWCFSNIAIQSTTDPAPLGVGV